MAFTSFQFHAAAPAAAWRSVLTAHQMRTLAGIIAETKPRYRKYLKFTFDDHNHLLVMFARNAVPADDGPESYVLNSCTSTPRCKHACDLQMHYSDRLVVPLPMNACLDGQLYFLTGD